MTPALVTFEAGKWGSLDRALTSANNPVISQRIHEALLIWEWFPIRENLMRLPDRRSMGLVPLEVTKPQFISFDDVSRDASKDASRARPTTSKTSHSGPVHDFANVKTLARFFTQSWLRGRPIDPAHVSAAINECADIFCYLSDCLPYCFKPYASRIQGILPTLPSGEHPVVLTHGDLNEMNIFICPSTGEITGVVDWAEAGFRPFGFALYALDNALGSMGPNEWEYFSNADYLRDQFWSSFSRLVGGLSESMMASIQLARVAGSLIRYGTAYDERSRGVVGVRDPSGASLRYLDALLSD